MLKPHSLAVGDFHASCAAAAASGRKLRTAHRPSPVMLGGVALMPEQANAMIARGCRTLVVGFDWSLLQHGIVAAIDGVAQ